MLEPVTKVPRDRSPKRRPRSRSRSSRRRKPNGATWQRCSNSDEEKAREAQCTAPLEPALVKDLIEEIGRDVREEVIRRTFQSLEAEGVVQTCHFAALPAGLRSAGRAAAAQNPARKSSLLGRPNPSGFDRPQKAQAERIISAGFPPETFDKHRANA